MALRPYQRKGVYHLRLNPRAALFFDMGLGKTATVLSALQPRHLPALVVAPKRVTENVWEEEVDRWSPGLRVCIAQGPKGRRESSLRTLSDITAISRDNLADALPYAKQYRTVIFDESSSFKDRSTKRWKAARALSTLIEHCWLMTGTPSPEGYMDLWAQMALLDGGERLGKYITHFRNQYFRAARRLPNSNVVTQWDLLPGAEERIQYLLSDVVYSLTNDDLVTLPGFGFNFVKVSLPPSAQRMYREMKDTMVAELDNYDMIAASSAAHRSNKLAQITAGWVYDDAGTHHPVHDAKMDALTEVIDGTGSPVFVLYNYTAERDAILKRYPYAATPQTPNLQRRWNNGEFKVLVSHPASLGHGMNLQKGGHTAVWTTLPWSLEQWEQTNRRLYRPGQQHPVTVHILEAPGTVDRLRYNRLIGKGDTQRDLMKHLEGK